MFNQIIHTRAGGQGWGRSFLKQNVTQLLTKLLILISKAAVFLMSTEQMCVIFCARLLTLFSSTVMWDEWLETIIY